MNNTTNSTDCTIHNRKKILPALLSLSKKCQRWFLADAKACAPLFLRVLLAYEFFEAGMEKISGDNWFTELIFPFPFNLLSADINWMLASGIEIIAPIALILGLATRFFSAVLIVLTIIAIATVHWPEQWHTLTELWKGYAITDEGFGNYKLPLMYIFMLMSLIFSGAGQLSVDAWFDNHIKRDNDRQ